MPTAHDTIAHIVWNLGKDFDPNAIKPTGPTQSSVYSPEAGYRLFFRTLGDRWRITADTHWDITSATRPNQRFGSHDVLTRDELAGMTLSLSASMGRSPEAIAGDIARKIRPGARRLAERATAERDAYDAANRRKLHAARRLADAAHGGLKPTDEKLDVSISATGMYGEIRPNGGGGSFDIRLRSVPFDVAHEVARLLGEAALRRDPRNH